MATPQSAYAYSPKSGKNWQSSHFGGEASAIPPPAVIFFHFVRDTLPLARYSGWVICASENTAAASAELPPLGGSDRQAAHYYRAQQCGHCSAKRASKQKAQAAEKIIVQLLVLIGWLLQQIRDLQRQLAWLKKQQFGRKSESRPKPPAESQPAHRRVERSGRRQPQNGAGDNSPGPKGPQRQLRSDLPEAKSSITPWSPRNGSVLAAARSGPNYRSGSKVKRSAGRCVWSAAGMCVTVMAPVVIGPPGRGIRTAPKPAKLIAKGLLAVDFWWRCC